MQASPPTQCPRRSSRSGVTQLPPLPGCRLLSSRSKRAPSIVTLAADPRAVPSPGLGHGPTSAFVRLPLQPRRPQTRREHRDSTHVSPCLSFRVGSADSPRGQVPGHAPPSARYLLDHEFVSEGSLDLELSCSGGERTNTSWPSRPSVRPASRRPRLASLPSTTPAAPSNLPVGPAIWTKQPKVRLKADCDADDWPRQICNLPPIASRPRLCQIAVVSLGCPRDAVPGMLRSAVVGDFSSAGRGTASPPQRCGI